MSFVTICLFKLSQFEFLSFVTIWVSELCHNLSFWVLSQFDFLSFATIGDFEFCHNLSFIVITILVLSFITFQVFKFCHDFKFWVFETKSICCHKKNGDKMLFVTFFVVVQIWVFEFGCKLSLTVTTVTNVTNVTTVTTVT